MIRVMDDLPFLCVEQWACVCVCGVGVGYNEYTVLQWRVYLPVGSLPTGGRVPVGGLMPGRGGLRLDLCVLWYT